MPFDSFVMAAVLAELRERATGAFVDQVYQPAPAQVVLAFTGGGRPQDRRRFWLASVEAEAARAYLAAARPEAEQAGAPPAFCMLLRKELRGSRLVEVRQPAFDRVALLRFARGDGERTLVHEVMGRHSNVILLDAAGTILDAAKRVPPGRSRVRPVLPGGSYQPPPGDREDPRALTEDRFLALAGGVDLEPGWFVRQLNGFSPFAAAELLARAGSPEGPARPEAAWPALRDLLEAVRKEDFEPVLWRTGAGEPEGYWAFPPRQVAADRQAPAVSMSAAVERVHGHAERIRRREERRREALAALDRAIGALRAQRDEAQRHLDGLDGAEQLRIAGELLLTGGHAVPRGARSAGLPNYYDPAGGTLQVELDPELSARENAEQYFRRYRRATAAAERAVDRLPAVEERLAGLEELRARGETAEEAELAELAARLKAEGIARPRPQAAAGPARKGEALPPGVRLRRYEVDGWEVVWGENATSNDYLTTRLARPWETWLHARAVTGAHVLVRGGGRDTPVPRAVLEAAARTAAAHSDARHSSVVPVDYTQRRYVRKPRGAAPGAVLYQNEKTLHVADPLRRTGDEEPTRS